MFDQSKIFCSTQTWSESEEPIVLRTRMDNGATVKTRRLATRPLRRVDALVVVPYAQYLEFKKYWAEDCGYGSLPADFPEPDGKLYTWRIMEPPKYELLGKAVRINLKLEQLPQWRAWI
jgi:hypothetical protein